MDRLKTPYKEIREEMKKMDDKQLSEEYSRISSGIEREILGLSNKGVIEGYSERDHNSFIFARVYGKKRIKYAFLIDHMGLNPEKEIKYKKNKKKVRELFDECCKEIEILEEYYERRFTN